MLLAVIRNGFCMCSDTGATDEDTNISGEIPPLDSGWSIADSRAQWLPRELEENKAIPFESMDPGDSTWTDTSTILGTAAVIIMTAYVIAQVRKFSASKMNIEYS
jgi:hypothetical protein